MSLSQNNITTAENESKLKLARQKKPLKILLAAPRGFCAGVDRAIQIVVRALDKYGPPVYVRHEIVHNKRVVKQLESQGAVFVQELDQVPDNAPVVFSAHGVPKQVSEEAKSRHLLYLDATCPLVSKVHIEAERHHRFGREIVLIGHSGHPEVVGTMGQVPEGVIHLVETLKDAQSFIPKEPDNLTYITQTTLSVDETRDIISALQARFPGIVGPAKDDICYATTNRQEAVKSLAHQADAVIVVGSANSSNSQRLVEVAQRNGCSKAIRVDCADELDWDWFDCANIIGLTAGASAPEQAVQEVISKFAAMFDLTVEEFISQTENVSFKLPRALAS